MSKLLPSQKKKLRQKQRKAEARAKKVCVYSLGQSLYLKFGEIIYNYHFQDCVLEVEISFFFFMRSKLKAKETEEIFRFSYLFLIILKIMCL